MITKREQIKDYWNERARQNSNSPTATTMDIYLRELEISTLISSLQEIGLSGNQKVLDVGCGDGYSLIKIALNFPGVSFVGLDYSEEMIKNALQRTYEYKFQQGHLNFIIGDVLKLDAVLNSRFFDVVISDRCLINIDNFKDQATAIEKIAKHIVPDGYYLAIENFIEGHKNMNEMRSQVGLPEIPIRWHNLYFKEEDFIKIVTNFFDIITFKDFSSSYYFATRIIYSAVCQMRKEEPDYNHEIHQIAVKLPWIGQFSPIRMVVLKKKKDL